MLAAAGHLCLAVDDLRAVGVGRFAEEIDRLLRVLDAKIALAEHQAFPRRSNEGAGMSSRDVTHPCGRRRRHQNPLL